MPERKITFVAALGFTDYRLAPGRLDRIEITMRAGGRTARPGYLVCAGFPMGLAHLSTEDACAEMVRRCGRQWAPDFMPGADLEAWLLPVVSFSYDFLLTPAEWEEPPEGAPVPAKPVKPAPVIPLRVYGREPVPELAMAA